ncbi:hypothetical protein K505DRAFT_101907 [Melanomma pulvis-pyrius CBS 109.77]|uniref:C2H2-type domain-containing protein n=1 Tax=Melanomma pulvis-pyrius CBS 109.77 TaxID=1314802 RepID=A0A6A6WYM4_9PLEO|nr:hypothetical protein K505DRAFT_101907 [Melanomma pulvis-pyrius CBS 109.77]
MSQPNNPFPPPFNYSEEYFDAQSSHISNASFPQWSHPGSRAMGNAPSPSPSAQTSRTAPNLRTSRVGWIPSVPREIDPTLPNASHLAPPQAPRPRTALESVGNADPMARFYNHDAPWSAHNPRSSSVAVARPYFSPSSMEYGMYREPPESEIESITRRSDSGYHTHHPRSVMSSDPERGVDQELPASMTLQVGNMNVNAGPGEQEDMFRGVSTDQGSQYSGRSANQGKEFRCEHCRELSKCKSDHKKHMLKHIKPFKCDIPNCKRGGQGFATENDLMRHKKSVHRIGMLTNSYQCASESCRNREKIWPRLDNFKQHIHRMHLNEDETDLIRRSQYQRQEPAPASQSMLVAPMDTTLAGIGTEKQFPGNDFDDPVSGISLTPDQDSSNWNSFDPNSHEFAIDVDQTAPNDYSHGSGKDSGYKFQDRSPTYGLHPGTARRNSNLERLDTLAAIASTQSPDKTIPQPHQLSNAPQTKADQQRQALQKFSKIIIQDIKNSNNGENVDLEDVVMRVLSGATKPDKKDRLSSHSTQGSPKAHSLLIDLESDTLTKGEALKASQAISNLIKQSGKPSHSRSRPNPTKGFLTNKLTCEHCGITLARSCDMRKHMKRHTKPYGCTYPKCHKRFGAKSDWKRHENSQHFQLESFRCQCPSPSSQIHCGELFYRAEIFTAHLQSQHQITQEAQLTHEVKMRRIGRNGQGQFWCGFCENIVKLEKKRNAAWDERFDHIDHHFSKEKKRIEEWLCVEAKKRKGEVAREVDKEVFDEEEEDAEPEGFEVDADAEGRRSSLAESILGSGAQAQAQKSSPSTSSSSKSSANPRKRLAESDLLAMSFFNSSAAPPPPQKRARRDVVRYCCSCQSGPWALHTYVDCMSCNHHLCGSCTVVGGAVNVDVGIAGLG